MNSVRGVVRRVVAPAATLVAGWGRSDARHLAPILCYHGITRTPCPGHVCVDSLREQLEYLVACRYAPLPLGNLVTCLSESGPSTCDGRTPVCVAFDDGYASVVENALPLLAEFGIRATAFIMPGLFGGDADWTTRPPADERRLMSRRDLDILVEAGIDIGGHGWTHCDLTTCTRMQLDEEIGRCAQFLREELGISRPLFSYPWARCDSRVEQTVRAAGYAGAIAASWTRYHGRPDIFRLGRLPVRHSDTMIDFVNMLSGAYGWWTRNWWRQG